MSTTLPSAPTTNGAAIPAPVQGVVVLNEGDYRQLLTERQELQDRVRELQELYELFRSSYKSIHHAYYELVKDTLPPEDPNWTPPSPEETVSMEEFMEEINKEFGGK